MDAMNGGLKKKSEFVIKILLRPTSELCFLVAQCGVGINESGTVEINYHLQFETISSQWKQELCYIVVAFTIP